MGLFYNVTRGDIFYMHSGRQGTATTPSPSSPPPSGQRPKPLPGHWWEAHADESWRERELHKATRVVENNMRIEHGLQHVDEAAKVRQAELAKVMKEAQRLREDRQKEMERMRATIRTPTWDEPVGRGRRPRPPPTAPSTYGSSSNAIRMSQSLPQLPGRGGSMEMDPDADGVVARTRWRKANMHVRINQYLSDPLASKSLTGEMLKAGQRDPTTLAAAATFDERQRKRAVTAECLFTRFERNKSGTPVRAVAFSHALFSIAANRLIAPEPLDEDSSYLYGDDEGGWDILDAGWSFCVGSTGGDTVVRIVDDPGPHMPVAGGGGDGGGGGGMGGGGMGGGGMGGGGMGGRDRVPQHARAGPSPGPGTAAAPTFNLRRAGQHAKVSGDGRSVRGEGSWCVPCGRPLPPGSGVHTIRFEVVSAGGGGCHLGMSSPTNAMGAPAGSFACPQGMSLGARGEMLDGGIKSAGGGGFRSGDVIMVRIDTSDPKGGLTWVDAQSGAVLHTMDAPQGRATTRMPSLRPAGGATIAIGGIAGRSAQMAARSRRAARPPARSPGQKRVVPARTVKAYEPGAAGTVWSPRVAWSDGKDLYDHDKVKLQQFEVDWKRALRIGVSKLVTRHDDDGAVDEDGDGIPDEVEDVASVLWERRDVWQLVFIYYAALGADADGQMSLNEWTQFTSDCRLFDKRSKVCNKTTVDQIFIAVDAMGARAQREVTQEIAKQKGNPLSKAPAGPSCTSGAHFASSVDAEAAKEQRQTRMQSLQRQKTMSLNGMAVGKDGEDMASGTQVKVSNITRNANLSTPLTSFGGDQQKSFSRTEFLVALVHLAISRYVLSGKTKDVSDALTSLIVADITPKVSSFIPVPDFFRHRHAYTREVDDLLRRHYETLQVLFSALTGGATGAGALVSGTVWRDFLRAARLLGTDCSEREAMLCFLWSRMVVIDDQSVVGSLKAANLPLEGFLEALCRVARLKALPTEVEVLAAGCTDAGELMLQLWDAPDSHREWFESARYYQWGEDALHDPQTEQQLPMAKRVEQLLMIIIRVVESESQTGGGLGDAKLTQREAAKWVKKHGVLNSN